ncbi:MAG: hypothetical protein KAG61_05815, partial [Bacteriovoracaceae bacterium]|nr:hypothetical protein [Bacteriovoracaceae bacterium]
MIFKAVSISVGLIFQTALAFASGYIIVNEGDTLSELVEKHSSPPSFLYGKSGRMEQVLKMNPSIVSPESIEVNQLLEFGDLLMSTPISGNTIPFRNFMIKKDFKKCSKKNAKYFRYGYYNCKSIGNGKKSCKRKKVYLCPKLKSKSQERKVATVQNKSGESTSRIQSIFVALTTGISSISSIDSTTNQQEIATSDLGVGGRVVWSHLWSKSIDFSFIGSYKKFRFRVGKDRVLQEDFVSKYYSGVALKYKLSQKNSLQFGVGVGESLVIKNNGGANLFVVEKASTSLARISGNHSVFKSLNNFSLDLSWEYGASLPSKQVGYSTELGTFYGLGVASSYNLDDLKLNISGT